MKKSRGAGILFESCYFALRLKCLIKTKGGSQLLLTCKTVVDFSLMTPHTSRLKSRRRKAEKQKAVLGSLL